DKGPLGTRRYRVVLEAIPAGEHRTFLHFGYAFEHNMLARMATTAYLATFGRHKLGFTVVGRQADGRLDHIRGLRGLVERNAMRYFLALDAHLAGIDAPPAQRLDRRLNRWFDGVERYPEQLGEVDRATYLAQKAADRRRDGDGGRAPER
ncbi:MAG: hypothetical protein KKC79_07380, partial [Gammaproteobacteria bacterium]|nr:hypothetical protein [Gammaproteobacteria bacterium]